MNRQALAAEPPGDEDRSTNAWQRLEQLTVPTLVVVGDLDYDVSTANALTAAQRIPVPRSTDCPMPPTSRFSRERGVPAGRHGVRRLPPSVGTWTRSTWLSIVASSHTTPPCSSPSTWIVRGDSVSTRTDVTVV